MKRPIQKIRGAILVMAALILVLLIGVAALALDLGRLFVLHTEMQNAVDAAVLSAAVELDGEAGALDRAKTAANQDMLDHLSHFSKKNELLEDLELSDLAFTFYSWIGSNQDSLDPPSDCDPDADGKCLTIDDADASYVQIELNPALLDVDDFRYEIDLYFLPVLSVLGIDTAKTASTRVVALAGSHYKVCNFPPMIVCYPEDLNPGQMVVLKTHSGGGAWTGGEFGWTIPSTEAVEGDPIDTSGFNDKKRLAHRLGSIYGQGCSSPIVEPKSGNLGNSSIRQGLNTRFGMYEDQFTSSDYPDLDSLPSAPNVIDYPRGDDLTLVKGGECELDEDAPNPSNGVWNFTECGNINGAAPDQQPSTYSRTAYNNVFHAGLPGPSSIRVDYYNWEVGSPPGLDNPAEIATAANDNIHNDESQCILGGNKKYVGINGNQNSCRMLNSDPFDVDFNGFVVPVDTTDEYKRRELFVAAIPNCADLSEKEINVPQVGGKWVKFFLTEHVDRPGAGEGLNVFAEFMGEVIQTDDEHFKKVIQLYE